ncbi:Putative transcriptional regulator with HTH domain (fragment) [Desulfosarcina cetonica]|uniref:AlbA family DNA-binding domain-containing protein n=1 Tax=Desulfosarcina cetonica TaxID=90730 RepID=UPI0006CF7DEC
MEIPQAENQYIEFKSEKVSAKNLAEEIVAFANAEGGEIWIGVEDDLQITGISRSYEEDIINICRSAVIPPLQPTYEEVDSEIKGIKIARISIPKGVDRPYYTSKNQYYIRVGSTKRIASREELIRLFQASGLFHYDRVEIDGTSVSHLDFSAISDYFSNYQISFATESEDEKIRLLTASDVLGPNEKSTLGGMLVFGISPEKILPQAGIAFAHFSGNHLDAELLDKKNFGGSLPRQVDNALAAIKANRPVASTIQGAKRVESPHYPDKVFRELLVNATVHRNYSVVGSQIRVFMFNDRIEFILLITDLGELDSNELNML